MSQEGLDRIERATELVRIWNTGDLDRYLETFAPDAVFNPDPSWPEQGPFTGEAIGRFLRNYMDAWEHAEIAIEAIEGYGEVVLMRCRWIIRGAGSGIDLPTAFSLVFRIDDEGLIRRSDAFFDEAEARRYAASAAGLRE
jgi:ketosteroid isomerase-like protein